MSVSDEPAAPTVTLKRRQRPRDRGTWPDRLVHSPAGVVGLALTATVVVVAILANRLAPGSPFHAEPAIRLRPPSWPHPMGTDNLGRDIYSGVVHGARTSMTVVAGVVVISSIIGLAVGLTSGYAGGTADDLIMRVAEIVQSIPRFFLAIAVAAWFGGSTDSLIVLLGVTSWTLLARVTRAQTLSLRRREFVESARALGSTTSRIILRHILPNVLPLAIEVIALTGSRVIILEAGLAFLGLGNPNVMSLGAIIANAENYLRQAWWMSVFPGIALTVAVLGFNLVGDAVAKVLDPNVVGQGADRRRIFSRAPRLEV